MVAYYSTWNGRITLCNQWRQKSFLLEKQRLLNLQKIYAN